MAKERRDNKNRLLRTGEYQRSDGRYEYKYIDAKGEKRSVYSWKLVQSDKTPKGKQIEMCLREMEKQIVRDNQDEIDGFTAKRMTLNKFFDIHIEERRLKDSTRTNYKYMYKKYVSEGLGQKNISDIKYSDIKRFYSSLIFEKGFKPRSMEVINTIIHPIFTMAVRDGYIRLNPTDGVMNEIKKSAMWDTPHRNALTVEQQEAFVNFTRSSKQYNHWMPLFTVLLGTGCRIGEIIGLRWEDCDFEENIISINHTLIYRLQDDGTCKFRITTPKTKAGIREIPMFNEVRETLKNEYMRQSITGFNQTVVDGYSGFIFQNRLGTVYSPHAVNRGIERICKAYNEFETERSEKENREALLLPHFSCHHLRHTFCTRMCENTSDQNTLKMIQTIMGHSDISTTLDIYTDLTRKKKKEAFDFLQGKMKLW
ncbi:MAG: integrase DNA-binding domain-containing protein [Candidatus Ornithomonoglobus sp.]